jgi:hypothetical protein
MVKPYASLSHRASFTLVEMLVAMVVLTLLILVVVKIVDFSLQLADSTGRSADSGIESNQVLDRIGSDIAGMVIRPDVDQFYYSGTAGENDKMFFYSQQTGFFNTNASSYYATNQSSVSLVGYRINTTDSPSGLPVLERLARGLTTGPDNDVNGGPYTLPLQYLTFPPATSAANYQTAVAGAITNVWGANESGTWKVHGLTGANGEVGSAGENYDDGASPYYHVVGNDVFRFEVCFQVQGANGPVYSLYPGYTNCAPVYPASITGTTAIVVAIAVLDAKSRQLVPAAKWSQLIAALQNPTAAQLTANPPILMASLWNSELPSIAATAKIPALAAAHIKIYQRCYYLNAPKNQ